MGALHCANYAKINKSLEKKLSLIQDVLKAEVYMSNCGILTQFGFVRTYFCATYVQTLPASLGNIFNMKSEAGGGCGGMTLTQSPVS